MNILMEILKVILSITIGTCAIIVLYFFWFKAVPEFWRIITKKKD
jgi:hypothetical protein